MPTAGAESYKSRKARLRASFLAQLQLRLQDARQRIDGLSVGGGQAEAVTALHLLFHTIKGSGGTFGFTGIAALAAEADELLKQAQQQGGRVDDDLIAKLKAILLGFEAPRLAEKDAAADDRFGFEAPAADRSDERAPGRTATASAQTHPATPSVTQAATQAATQDASESVAPIAGHATAAVPTTTRRPGDTGDERRDKRIYLCDDDEELAAQLTGQLACFGYRVTPFASLAALCDAVAEATPMALIMDVMFPEGEHAGPESMAGIFARAGSKVPCIFMSARDTFPARLQAVKAGGSAYCPKPVKTAEMVELLDRLTNTQAPDPFHILVVDDDPDVARLHALVLEAAGMVVRFATRPDEVLSLLDGFNADLVLMDMYMPECSGPELARVLRQMPGYLSLPIIYVSAETDIALQLQALEVGADGFLTKPIDRAHLVAEVNLRAERMRTLHGLMVRDGLTGLFNHNAIMQFLEIGVADARRESQPLCFAMIDVDRFKLVNDSYGHPAGDQVLMALSRGLRLRLRGSDLVGRYGGEEFAVVLRGVDAPQAKAILDDLRERFASVVFYAGEERFTCTFSGGVASFPLFPSEESLTEAADLALYRAKRGGRNRIEIADPAELRDQPAEAQV